ncbi:hypothetical protein BD309DRAFT_55444 [Dichomitus squalens]|uniref:Uncharacterized protein n=1 Tax=Dichomitus squalens TaxID=114155 RepID=A0A4Q9P501_9APHY|nr:hypothetical protein BD311DRAFT_395073 [Dichomitus squalens]TBU49524.1 hypothetical protein BD309DRAFT_55444 [Dichomitus squalens]
MLLVPVAALELRPAANLNELALNTTEYYAADFPYAVLDVALSSVLFGVLTSLVFVALIFLTQRGLAHTAVRILLPSTLLLYGSTALYMAGLASYVVSVNRLVTKAQRNLFSDSFSDADISAFQDDILKQSWMMTAALGMNILIGDSIVWWRACVLWKNRVVYCVGPLLIMLVFAFGVKALSGVETCTSPCRQPEMLLPNGAFTDVCAILSLAVNAIATILIGHKAWVYRRVLRGQLGRGRSKMRAMKALALLVESGMIYCILLIIVVIYEASSASFVSPDVHQNGFLDTVAYYTYACFIPVIAIYPVLIIVIVALNWSPIEHSMTQVNMTGHGAPGSPHDARDHEGFTMSTVVMTDTLHSQYTQDDVIEDPRQKDTEAARS